MSSGSNFGSMVLNTASDDRCDNFPYAKIHQSSTIGNSGSPHSLEVNGASAVVGSVNNGGVSAVGKHFDVDDDLSLACGLDTKPHSVDVVVGTVCQFESHELGHISPNYPWPETVLLAAQATPIPYATHDVTGALANSGSKEQEYSIDQNTLSGTESLTRVPKSASTEQTANHALSLFNTSNSCSPQLLALVEQLSTGDKS
jgi:hypothetical protein